MPPPLAALALVLSLWTGTAAQAQSTATDPATPRKNSTTEADSAPSSSTRSEATAYSFDTLAAGSGESTSASGDSGSSGVGLNGSWQPPAASDAFRINLAGNSNASSSVNVTFVGVAFPADVALWSMDTSTFVGNLPSSSSSLGGVFNAESGNVFRGSSLDELTATATLEGSTLSSVVAVPEPSVSALLLAGLGILAFKRRRD